MIDKNLMEQMLAKHKIGLSNYEFDWYNFQTNAKIENIVSKQNFMLLFTDSFYLQIDERLTNDLIHSLNEIFDIGYQLNDNDILDVLIKTYKSYFLSIFEKLYLSNPDSARKEQIINLKNEVFASINFWESVYSYHQFFEKVPFINFTTNDSFRFDFNKISNYMKILKKEHLVQYSNSLKLIFATNLTNINIFEFDYKLNYLVEYYQQFEVKRQNPFTRNDIISITYNTLLKIGLKNDFDEFEKASNGNKQILRFLKSQISEVETPFVYLIGIILSKLEENKKIKNFDFSKISLQIIGNHSANKLLQYDDVIKQKEKHIKNNSVENNWEDQLINRFEYYRNWIEELNKLNLFRFSLLFQ